MIQLNKYAKLLVKETVDITDDMRIVMTRNPLDLDINRKYSQEVRMKPRGFWYGFGTKWIDWCKDEMPEWVGEYFYSVDIGSSNVLKIKSAWQLGEFTKQYEVHGYTGHHISEQPVPPLRIGSNHMLSVNHIDWPSVANKYDGIEIAPYQFSASYNYMWYYGWDVASGCIWNLKNVKVNQLNYTV